VFLLILIFSTEALRYRVHREKYFIYLIPSLGGGRGWVLLLFDAILIPLCPLVLSLMSFVFNYPCKSVQSVKSAFFTAFNYPHLLLPHMSFPLLATTADAATMLLLHIPWDKSHGYYSVALSGLLSIYNANY
jgi:hypothetical protein